MKKLWIVLPLAVLLAYCSGPNNTQTTDTETDDASISASTTETTDEVATTTTDVSDEAVTTNEITLATTPVNNTSPIPDDPNHPMYQHWQRTNAKYWTWDMDYPGFNRPVAGSYNTAVNGDWQLVMTPSLVTAWRKDNSGSLWLRNGDVYLSASESFNTKTGVNAATDMDVVATTDLNSINYNAYNGNMYQLPRLNLYFDNASFTGHTGCNAISGRLEISGNSIRFLNTAPSTAIDCMGGFGQGTLLDLLNRVDSYTYVGDELQLMQGSEILLRLKKNGQEASLK